MPTIADLRAALAGAELQLVHEAQLPAVVATVEEAERAAERARKRAIQAQEEERKARQALSQARRDRADAIRSLLASGASVGVVADAAGVTPDVVRRWAGKVEAAESQEVDLVVGEQREDLVTALDEATGLTSGGWSQ